MCEKFCICPWAKVHTGFKRTECYTIVGAKLTYYATLIQKFHHHHHLPPWIRSFDMFRHRRNAIVSWDIHNLFFLEVCSWGRVSAVWCCPFFQGGWSSFVCIWVSRLVFQRSLVLFLWLGFLFYSALCTPYTVLRKRISAASTELHFKIQSPPHSKHMESLSIAKTNCSMLLRGEKNHCLSWGAE